MKKLFITLLLTLSLIFAQEANDFTQSNNLFAASLYKEILKKNEENVLVSPFSVEMVLALAQSGAKGGTLKELRTTLFLPYNQDQIESGVRTLLSSLKSKDNNYSFNIANKIYIKEGYPIKAPFQKIATEVFHADIENVDFSHKTETANRINKWVGERTADKIHNVLNPNSLDSNTEAILINALYFQANWSRQFIPHFTKRRSFHKNENSVLIVPIMHDYSGIYNYYEDLDLNAKFVEIPFKDNKVSMTFILPNDRHGLSSLEKHIDAIFVPKQYTKELVNLALPKFKIESKLDCKHILKNLGVRKAFDKADFSGISTEPLFIDEIVQKTFIQIGEDGVEATTATEIEMSTRSGMFFPLPHMKQFIADHPFMFYIKVKDLIIFVGRVSSPKL